jgi:hypothetical protein
MTQCETKDHTPNAQATADPMYHSLRHALSPPFCACTPVFGAKSRAARHANRRVGGYNRGQRFVTLANEGFYRLELPLANYRGAHGRAREKTNTSGGADGARTRSIGDLVRGTVN